MSINNSMAKSKEELKFLPHRDHYKQRREISVKTILPVKRKN